MSATLPFLPFEMKIFLQNYISRPRVIFAGTFVWLTVLGGRFLAPFLENEAGLSPAGIGICLSCQQLVLTIASGWAGKWADSRENRNITHATSQTRFSGRIQVILFGIVLATSAFLLHGMHHIFPKQTTFFQSLEWHAGLQMIQGLGVSMVFPVLDGLTIDFLENSSSRSNRSSTTAPSDRRDYGRERLHGPLWWALANVMLSPCFDNSRIGFRICYPLSVVGGILVASICWMFLVHSNIDFSPSPPPLQLIPTRLEEEGTVRVSSKASSELEVEELTSYQPTTSSTTQLDSLFLNNDSLHLVDAADTNQLDTPLTELLRLLLTASVPGGGGGAFLFCIVCISSGQAVVDNLVFLFFEALGSQWIVMGITVVIKIAFEVPIFYSGPYLLRRYGPGTVLLLGCICYLIRVISYPFTPQGHVLFPVLLEPLHGITYGSVQVAVVDFVAQAMPPGHEAAGQGLVYLFKDGGSVIGVLIGGLADSSSGSGSDLMFIISASIVSTGALVLFLQKTSRMMRARVDGTETEIMVEHVSLAPVREGEE